MRNYIYINISFSGDVTQMVLPLMVHGVRLDRLSLALILGPAVMHFPELFDGVASYLKKCKPFFKCIDRPHKFLMQDIFYS